MNRFRVGEEGVERKKQERGKKTQLITEKKKRLIGRV
jgi:hypothetical protein